MSTVNNEDQVIIFNTPAGFKFESSFSDLSIKFKPKVEFLIHQINFYDYKGGYQVHSKNHKWFFGIKGTELAMMLRRLVESGIIKLAINFTPGNTSNTYKMVRPFNILDPTTQKSFYHPNDILFVKKWIMDGHIVKSAANSNFKKEVKTTTTATIAEQQTQIKELQAQLAELMAQLKTNIQPQFTDNCKSVQVSGFTIPMRETKLEENINISVNLVQQAENRKDEVPTSETSKLQLGDETEVEELALMFGGQTSPVSNNGINFTTKLAESEAVTLESSTNRSGSQFIKEQSTIDNNETADTETYLNGNLKVHYLYLEDRLVIEYGTKFGVIENFDKMQSWCNHMISSDKERLFHQLITSTGQTVFFQLNEHTKSQFTSEVVDGNLHIRYQKMFDA